MRTTRVFIVVASLSLLAAFAHARSQTTVHAYQYVQNGGFEQGAEPWRVNAGGADLTAVDATVVAPAEGGSSGAVTLRAGETTFFLRQTAFVPLGAGTYHLSAQARATDADANVSIQVFGDPNAFSTAPFDSPRMSTTSWTEIGGDFAFPDVASVRIEITGHAHGGETIYLDDVRIDGAPPATVTPTPTPTPPPATSPQGETPTRTPRATSTPRATRTPRPDASPQATDTPVMGSLAPNAADSVGETLVNAGFEAAGGDGAPLGWAKFGGALSTSDAPVRSGARAARYESDTASTKWFYQVVAVDPGAAYEFSAWIYDNDPAVLSASLRVSWYASTDGGGPQLATSDSGQTLGSPADGYRLLTTGGVVAPGDARSARLRVMLAPVAAAPATIFVDDASFAPAALPTAQAAAAVAAGAAGAGAPDNRVLGESRQPRQVASNVATPAALPSSAHVVINEVLYDPDGGGADAANEWVELYNAGAQVSLAGWSITDNKGGDELPALTIKPGEFLVLAASDSFRARYPDFTGALAILGGRIGSALGNNGDRLTLADASGAIVDAISWGSDTSILNPSIPDVPSGHSIERRSPGADSDSASDFVDNEAPSPGRGILPPAAKPPAQAANESRVEALPGRRSSLAWLPWALVGVSSAAGVAAVSWRALPLLAQRLRHQP